MTAYHTHYSAWALERVLKGFVRYILLLPLYLVTWPITELGNWLGEMFYRL